MVNRYQLRARRLRRKAYKRTKYGAAKIRKYRKMGAKTGFMRVTRMAKEIVSTGSGLIGSYTITGTQNCIALGTPVSIPGTNGLYNVPFAITARLDDVLNVSELTALFDQYKINGLTVKVQGWNASGAPGTPLPYFQFAVDHDSNNVPTSLSLFRERMGIKTRYLSANRPAVTMSFKPRVAPEVYSTAGGIGYAVPTRSMWINTLNTNVEHYCATGYIRNLYIPAQAGVSDLTWDVKFSLSFKDVQ